MFKCMRENAIYSRVFTMFISTYFVMMMKLIMITICTTHSFFLLIFNMFMLFCLISMRMILFVMVLATMI